MNYISHLLVITCLSASAAAFAAGDTSYSADPRPSADPVMSSVQAAFGRKDWSGAQTELQKALLASPQNADYHNLYAYSIRKGANPNMDLVFKHYGEALRINPKHRGAHEYVGEAYLMVNDLPKAKQHLATLDKLCFMPCEEHSDLKKAIAAYEAKRKP
ncbi:tetratricopeptide repeat protein [Polaromonas sp.]|uniref:tetratricopeptide repeat protein n=1 Tax=Polaromonas sp. TaxID=1869339 RepID=UPI0037501884